MKEVLTEKKSQYITTCGGSQMKSLGGKHWLQTPSACMSNEELLELHEVLLGHIAVLYDNEEIKA